MQAQGDRTLHEFLTRNREALIARCREKVARRPGRQQAEPALEYGIPVFLNQLITRLRDDAVDAVPASDTASAAALPVPSPPRSTDIGRTAARHGDELLRTGYTVDQVVHDYGDLCQAVTEMAVEQDTTVSAHEFRLLNGCLDEAIADAITEFGRQRDRVAAENTDASNERLASFAHELRNLIGNAILAVAAIKKGSAGLSGSTGALLDRSLIGMRDLVNRTLAEARLAHMPARPQRISVGELVADVRDATVLEVAGRDLEFVVAPVDAGLAIEGDRQLLAGALNNLLQNAVKFTRARGRIDLTIRTAGGRVLIEIADECGGLAAGAEDEIFRPFEQLGAPQSGLGLGLAISRRSVEANGGELRVRSVPGTACIFTVDLPAAAGKATS